MRKCTKILVDTLALLLLIGIIPVSAKPMEPFVPKKLEAIEDAAPKMILIEDGESGYVIVRGAQASLSEVTAAEKLSEYLERISGCALPIVTDEAPAQGKEIVVGKTNREGPDTYQIPRDELGDDGFILRTTGESVIIAGGEKRGTLYGVFDFLEKFLGCLWLTSEVTVVPEAKTVAVPAEIDVLEIPAFAFRNPIVVPYLCRGADYCLANRINAGTGQVAGEEYGGVMNLNAGHNVGSVLKDEYFGEHPQWFALNKKGERVCGEYANPCMINEEVIQLYIAYALEYAAMETPPACISMALNDTDLCCQCESCVAVYVEEGTRGGRGESGATLVRMLNRVSQALDEIGSDMKIGTLAYAASMDAPKHTKLSDRVVVWFAPITMCYAHPLKTCTGKESTYNRSQLEGWVKIAGNFVQYDYPSNYDYWNLPYPMWAALPMNIQYFYENGFIGLYNCGGAECDYGLFSMTGWLYAKLLWDPYADMDELYAQFLPVYYGDGWQYVREYIRIAGEELTGRKVWGKTGHFDRGQGAGNKGLLYMKRGELEYVDALWENALALGGEGWQLANLRRAQLTHRVWKADTMKGEFRGLFSSGRIASNKQLLEDIWELDVTILGFDHKFVTVEQSERLKIYRLMPRYWSGRQLGYDVIGGIDSAGKDRGQGRAKNFAQLVWGWIMD